jgi:hypothetical protein
MMPVQLTKKGVAMPSGHFSSLKAEDNVLANFQLGQPRIFALFKMINTVEIDVKFVNFLMRIHRLEYKWGFSSGFDILESKFFFKHFWKNNFIASTQTRTLTVP